jgi:hypothetical protein
MLRRGVLVLGLLFAIGQSAAWAQSLKVAPLPRDRHVLVSFKLDGAFTDEMETAVHSGLTVSFVYDIDLKRGSTLWFDRTIASTSVTATVRYDNLLRRYYVSRMVDGRTERAETTDREDVVREWLTSDFDRLPLFQNVTLEVNGEYYVRVRVHTSPRNAAFVWPWQGHDAMASAKFTIVQ